jgi:hypothetical protein
LLLAVLNSVKERGSNGALRSHLFAKERDENAPQLYGLFFICSAELKRAGTQSLHRQIGREPR